MISLEVERRRATDDLPTHLYFLTLLLHLDINHIFLILYDALLLVIGADDAGQH